MSRIKRGWGLTKKSWALLNEHRELIRFPLYGAIATMPLAILFLGPGLYLLDKDTFAGAIPLLVIGVYVLSVVGFYFSVGLAAAANMIFNGEQATVADGLAVARASFSQICGWAALSTAISVLMAVLENQGGLRRQHRRAPGRDGLVAGHLPGGAGDRDRGHRAARDAEALGLDLPPALGPADHRQHRDRRRRLPDRRAARGAPDRRRRRPLVLRLLPRCPAGRDRRPGPGVAMLVSKALSGVFGVALYRYALDGQAVGGFTQEELESAVKVKKGKRNAPPTATPGTV